MTDPLTFPAVSGRTAWDDIQALAAQSGHTVKFEHLTRDRPPLVCEPEPIDWEWSVPSGPMPEFEDEPAQCRVHRGEWWPCQTMRERGGITVQGPETVQQLVMRKVHD